MPPEGAVMAAQRLCSTLRSIFANGLRIVKQIAVHPSPHRSHQGCTVRPQMPPDNALWPHWLVGCNGDFAHAGG